MAIAADAAGVTPGHVCANESARLVQPIAALTRCTGAAIVGPVKEFHDFGAQSAQLLMEHVDPAGRGVGCGPLLFCHGVQKRDIRQCFRSFTIAWLHASPEHGSRLTDIGGLPPESRPCSDGLGDSGNAFGAPAAVAGHRNSPRVIRPAATARPALLI